MSTAVQVQYRRGTASQIASFTGAQGEMAVDTTNNRVVVQDGATAGGFAAAKLSETQTISRTTVSDANYSAATTDRSIAYTALTAARTVTLPAASSFPGRSRMRPGTARRRNRSRWRVRHPSPISSRHRIANRLLHWRTRRDGR